MCVSASALCATLESSVKFRRHQLKTRHVAKCRVIELDDRMPRVLVLDGLFEEVGATASENNPLDICRRAYIRR
jgi:hypothetical protein